MVKDKVLMFMKFTIFPPQYLVAWWFHNNKNQPISLKNSQKYIFWTFGQLIPCEIFLILNKVPEIQKIIRNFFGYFWDFLADFCCCENYHATKCWGGKMVKDKVLIFIKFTIFPPQNLAISETFWLNWENFPDF